MKSFLRIFFATFLALILFALVLAFIVSVILNNAINVQPSVSVPNGSVLVFDLGNPIREQNNISPLNTLLRGGNASIPGLYELTSSIRRAAVDGRVRGIYLKADEDPNGFATSEALRRALLEFKNSGKFIYAYGSVINQKAYYVASVSDKLYLNPVGNLDFSGFSTQMFFLKGALDKLDIKPQIFYEGKYKSATEPLRETGMTEANKIQTKEYLGNLYRHFLKGVSDERHLDTATLFRYADSGLIRTAYDAERFGLVDGLKYDDEVRSSLREKLGIPRNARIPFVDLIKYTKTRFSDDGQATRDNQTIALLYAQGDIVSSDGAGSGDPLISATFYIDQIRKLREDSSIRAIVLRVNSPGGSALAADQIWRAILLTRQVKPVIVSMGDYAASGGYYISCGADSIFAEPNTLTGSIGVFGVIPDMQSFFKNKLGVTFDGVKTGRYADMGTFSRPLTPAERQFIQADIDSVYATFKRRVQDGRHLSQQVVDSIAQGRVWSGMDAVKLGLVDKLGGIPSAIASAAAMAHLSSYTVREFPERQAPFRKVFDELTSDMQTHTLKEQLGQHYSLFMQLKRVTQSDGEILARLPYSIIVN